MQGPLENLEQWDDFVKDRYDPNRKQDEFRKFTVEAPPVVQEFYRQNHKYQTRDFVLQKKREYLPLNKRRMGDLGGHGVSQHAGGRQRPRYEPVANRASHANLRGDSRDGRPRWFILTGLIHDLGKILCLYGEPQWAVVGDTFPVGCAYSDKIVYPEFFAANPDSSNPRYQAPLGVYEEGCGLGKVDVSWGHDEYLYHVVKDYLPDEALYMIRYHSFYPWHKEGAYHQFMDERDKRMLPWVNEFNPYDLYSKSAERPDVEKVKPFYDELIAEYLPAELSW